MPADEERHADADENGVVTRDGPLPPSRPFLIGLLLILILITFLLARPYLGAIVLALLVAFMVYPLHRRMAPHMRWPSLSAFLLLIGVVLVIVAPFVFVVWHIFDQLSTLFTMLQDPARMEARIRDLLAMAGIEGQEAARVISTGGERLAGFAAGAVLPTLQFILKMFLGLVVFLFILFFAIRDGGKWVEALKGYTPLDPKDKEALFTGARDSVWAIVMGTFVVSIIQGVIAAIGWWFLGFPDPIFWGFVMTILAVLPFLGAFVVAVPAGVIAIINGDYFAGIGLLVYTTVVVGLSDDLLRPYLIGKRSGIHPVFILIGILGGVAVFGVAGFVLGPLILALLPPVMQVWGDRRKQRAHDQGLAPNEEIH